MLRYAARAPERGPLAAGTGLVGLLLWLVAYDGHLWRVLVLASAASVAAGAWAMDEPSARVVDAVPRSLRWRSGGRLVRTLPLLLEWLVFASAVSGRPAATPGSGRAWPLVALGAGSLLVGATSATCLRRRGWAAPGQQVGVVAGLVLASTGLFPKHLPGHPALFPLHADADWAWSLRFWSGVVTTSLVVLVVVTSERLPRHRHTRTT